MSKNSADKPARILIVDDEGIIAMDLKQEMIALGYHVCGTALSGEAALEITERERPDLVLMDIVLAGEMDGIQTADAIREKYHIPVVFITAYADQERLKRAKLTYPFGYIIKPFQSRELGITIEMALAIGQVESERKKGEKALRYERNRAQGYLDTVEAIIVALDFLGRVTLINKVGARLLGYKGEELIGRHWFSTCLPQPDGLENIYPFFLKLIAGEIETFEYFENPIITRSGELRQIAWHNSFLRDPQGEIIGTLSAGEDITKRKQMEEALRESEKKYRDLVDNLNDVIYALQADGTITFVSPAVETVIGYTPNELIGTRFFPLIHPDDLERIRGEFSDLLQGRLYPGEYRLLAKDGAIHWVRSSSRPVHDGERLIGLHGMLTDITEQKIADEKIQEQARLNQILLDSFPCVALLLRPKTREIVALNKAAKEAGCLVGQTCFRTWPEFKEPCPWCLAEDLWAEGRPKSIEVAALGIIWDAHWVPVSDDLYLHYAFDVTERKAAEEALNQKMAEFERFNKLTVARELRMVELKKEINALLLKTGEKEKYRIVE